MAEGFYFAWVTSQVTFSAATHKVEDEQVFAVEITQREGDFASLRLDIRNPNVGLLKAGRKRWCWLSWEDGEGTVHPLFHGRLVGVPEDITEEIVRLMFVARPANAAAQKEALAATMRTAPYYSPLFLDDAAREDPDTVLTARAELWYVNPLTLVISTSSIINGEAGTLVFTEDDFFYDGLKVSFGQTPLRRVKIDLSAQWSQIASGTMSLRDQIWQAAAAAGSTSGNYLASYTGEGLVQDWPERGAGIGGNWRVSTSWAKRIDGVRAAPSILEVPFKIIREPDPDTPGESAPPEKYLANFPKHVIDFDFVVAYEVSRRREERAVLNVRADVQELFVDDDADDALMVIQLRTQPLHEEIGGDAGIADPKRRSFFPTDEGQDAISYALALARAHLLNRARAVSITFETRWSAGLQVTLRHNVQLNDPRLPGGQVIGKVTGYTLKAENGQMLAVVTLAGTIGRGNSVAASSGTGDYVEDDYVTGDYTIRTDETIMPIAGEITYSTAFKATEPDDDGLDFGSMTPESSGTEGPILKGVTLLNGAASQAVVLNSYAGGTKSPVDALDQLYTTIKVELLPIGAGPYRTDYEIEVSDLMIPKMIDLEAS